MGGDRRGSSERINPMDMKNYFDRRAEIMALLQRENLTVAERNEINRSDVVHPHTCGGKDCRAVLTATETGWRCEVCGYEQAGGMF